MIKVDYAPTSYVGLRVGRRVWCPVWPVTKGGTVHLPDPDRSKDEESPAYEHFRERLLNIGLAPSWTPSYNAGANPITVRLSAGDLERDEVQELLRASYDFLAKKAAWSDGVAAADENGSCDPVASVGAPLKEAGNTGLAGAGNSTPD